MPASLRNVYRPEIDGLRGMSILAVYFYHINLGFYEQNIFRGGFIGVDIFFVISGYIITTISLHDEKINNFNAIKFYTRRIKRILPIAFLVMFIITIYSYYFDTYSKFNLNFELAKSSFLLFANFFLYFQQIEYNSINSDYIPLLHYWSLSIEEQFYIIFPLIFLLKSLRFYFFTLIFFISLFLCITISNIDFEKSFYFSYTRIWEILLGVITAILNNNYNLTKSKKIFYYKYFLLFIIIIFIILGNQKNFYPFNIIFITTITALVLFKHKDEKTNAILSNSILIYIGKISFSLYLIHFPVLSYLRSYDFINSGTSTNSIKVGFLLLLFLIFISILSYKIIEKPFREKISLTYTIIFLSTIFALINIINSYFWAIKKSNDNFQTVNTRIIQDGAICYNRKKNFCTIDNGKNLSIILVGSSKALEFEKLIIDDKELDFNKILTTHYDCDMLVPGYLQGIYNKAKNSFILTCSEELQNNRLKEINKSNAIVIYFTDQLLEIYNQKYFTNFLNYKSDSLGKVQSIINKEKCLISTADVQIYSVKKTCIHYFNKEQQKEIISNAINQTVKTISDKHKIIIVYPIPQHGWDVPKIYTTPNFVEFIKDRIVKNRNTRHDRVNFYESSKIISEMKKNKTFYIPIDDYNNYLGNFKMILDDHKNFTEQVYPEKTLCDKKKCYSTKNGLMYYIDDDHLSEVGAKIVYKNIKKIIKEKF